MNRRSIIKISLSFFCLFLAYIPIMGQNKEVKGTIFEANKATTIVGATVLQKGTTNGTIADIKGNYTIEVTGENPVLEIRSLGFITQEISVANRSVIDIYLQEDAVLLDAVVVTALGITREEKSLGYSVSNIKSDELTKSVSGNWLDAIGGKVAGLTFDQAGSGPTGSKRVTIRGDNSLNYGNNEALFIIDGVPVLSGAMAATSSSSNYASNDAPVDFGNAASDINPEDIESVSVLKGPSATALYGSRAANGAIVITTKSGKKNKGIGVSINSSVVIEKAGFWPEFQKEYGSGSDMGKSEFCFWNLTSDMASDGVATTRNYSRYAFGEKFDANKLRYQYASKNWDTNQYTRLPWVYQDDWYTGLFKTGVTYNNSVTIDGGNGNGTSTRFSYSDTHNDWILPNTGYEKQNISLSYNTEVNKYIKLNAKVNYYHKATDNMPVSGYSAASPMYSLVWGFNTNSINCWKDEYFKGRYNQTNWEGLGSLTSAGKSLVYPSSLSYNPYRTLYEELNYQDKNRVFGNISITVDLYKGLTLNLRSGLDIEDDFRTQKKPYYTIEYEYGLYREQTVRHNEFNNDFLLRYVNETLANDQFGLTVAFGGNKLRQEYYQNKITISQLGLEGVYNLDNLATGTIPDLYNYRTKKEVNSLYGMATLSWKDIYYLDITGRNDWSSALSKEYCSFFYPSVSASVLLNELFNFKENAKWINFTKLRLSWANVGNDTSPYQLDQYYSSTSYSGGYTLPSTITNPKIKPENVESWEAGLEAKLLNNRISFDFTVYQSSTTNQIVSVDTDQITGATGMKINAGEIQNKGIEIGARFVPVKNKNFSYSVDVTWAKNINKLVSLQDGWDPSEPFQTELGTTIKNRLYIYSYIGQEMHQIYGKGYQRAPKGSYYTNENGEKVDCSGMKLVDASGYPVLDTEATRKIGNVNPDWKAGMIHSFTYKNLSLSASFSAQLGGHCYSVTNFSLSYQGKLKNSLPGRYDGLVVDGVSSTTNADGSFNKNTTITNNIQTYYNSFVWSRDNAEENTFDTSFLKLKEVRLDYKVPAKLCQKTKVLQNASMGVFATNLFCITKFPQYDPEAAMLNGSTIHRGLEAMSFPMTRSYGFNVKLAF